MLDLIVTGAAHYYLEHETLEDDDASAVGIYYSILQVFDLHVKDVEKGWILLEELSQRLPEPGWVGSEDPQTSWLGWIKSALDMLAQEEGPLAQLVIDELEQNHGVNYAEHFADRRRRVHERDMARSEAHAQ